MHSLSSYFRIEKNSLKFSWILLLIPITACYGQINKEQKEVALNIEHRFEFKGCEAYYNGQKLPFLQPLSAWVEIFGPYDAKKNSFFTWSNIPMNVSIYDFEDSLAKEMAIIFDYEDKEDDPYPKKFQNRIMLDGIVFDKHTSITKLNETFSDNPFFESPYSSRVYYRMEEIKCDPLIRQSIYFIEDGHNTMFIMSRGRAFKDENGEF